MPPFSGRALRAPVGSNQALLPSKREHGSMNDTCVPQTSVDSVNCRL